MLGLLPNLCILLLFRLFSISFFHKVVGEPVITDPP